MSWYKQCRIQSNCHTRNILLCLLGLDLQNCSEAKHIFQIACWGKRGCSRDGETILGMSNCCSRRLDILGIITCIVLSGWRQVTTRFLAMWPWLNNCQWVPSLRWCKATWHRVFWYSWSEWFIWNCSTSVVPYLCKRSENHYRHWLTRSDILRASPT